MQALRLGRSLKMLKINTYPCDSAKTRQKNNYETALSAHAHCAQCATISPEKHHGENAPLTCRSSPQKDPRERRGKETETGVGLITRRVLIEKKN